jgi:hypothetical protein
MTRRTRVHTVLLVALCGLVAGLSGCATLRALAYYASPPQIQKPEFEFPPGSRVLVMLDPARPEYESPVFGRALYDKLVLIFREKKSTVELLSPRVVNDLRKSNPDLDSWSVQRIGQEAGAKYVLWIRVDRYQTRQAGDYPVLEPLADLRTKVIAVDHPATDARVWPTEKDGRKISCTRPVQEASDASSEDVAAKKLARDTAWYVAFPFFEQNLEENPPREE